MFSAPFKVVLDANVLFPFSLRDTLLRAAEHGLFQLYRSEEILEEARRSLVKTSTMTEPNAVKLVDIIKRVFPEAMVSGYEHLIAAMKNEEGDRHVLAAAVKCGAQVIVTSNVRDFRELPDGIEAQTTDEFLCNLHNLDPQRVVDLLEEQAVALKNPPHTFEQLLNRLAKLVPNFVEAVRSSQEQHE